MSLEYKRHFLLLGCIPVNAIIFFCSLLHPHPLQLVIFKMFIWALHPENWVTIISTVVGDWCILQGRNRCLWFKPQRFGNCLLPQHKLKYTDQYSMCIWLYIWRELRKIKFHRASFGTWLLPQESTGECCPEKQVKSVAVRESWVPALWKHKWMPTSLSLRVNVLLIEYYFRVNRKKQE